MVQLRIESRENRDDDSRFCEPIFSFRVFATLEPKNKKLTMDAITTIVY